MAPPQYICGENLEIAMFMILFCLALPLLFREIDGVGTAFRHGATYSKPSFLRTGYVRPRSKIAPRRHPGHPKATQNRSEWLPEPFRAPSDPLELGIPLSGRPRRARMAAKRIPREPSGNAKGRPAQLRWHPRIEKNARGEHFTPKKLPYRVSTVFFTRFLVFWLINQRKTQHAVATFTCVSHPSKTMRFAGYPACGRCF